MKIVDKKEFLQLPSGTVYATYEPCILGDLSIKGDCTLSGEDFYCLEFASSIESSSSEEFFARLTDMEHSGKSFPVDLDSKAIDGCYKSSQLYTVWGKEDVQSLIAILQKSLANFN